MSEVQTIEAETELKINADTTFRLIKHDFHNLPEIYPEIYKGCEIIHGDGTKNGCVRIWRYILPDNPEEMLFVKVQNEDMEDNKHQIGLTAIDGDILKYYKKWEVKIFVIPKDEGCLVKWIIKYQKAKEDVSDPHHYLDIFGALNKKMEAHLLQNEAK